jgi:cell division protein FtsI (penicillin-binding protein 3)
LPDVDAGEVRDRLSSRKGFVWLKREITQQQQKDIYRLGIPGIGFLRENKRVYPNGPIVSHLIGHVNIDNQGIAGIEKWLDSNGLADLHRAGFATDRQQEPVQLAVDLRVEHALRDELLKAKESSRPRRPPDWFRMSIRAKSSPWFRCRITIRTIRARPMIRRASIA